MSFFDKIYDIAHTDLFGRLIPEENDLNHAAAGSIKSPLKTL